jgi:hypothetical protein
LEAQVNELDTEIEETEIEGAVELPAEKPSVDPVRSAAAKRGAERVHNLVLLGQQYEKEHGLTPGRERMKQLIRFGKRYEAEHGLREAGSRRKKRGDQWKEFVEALSGIVKPKYRPALEMLIQKLG